MPTDSKLRQIADLLLRNGAVASGASLVHAAALSDFGLLQRLADAGCPVDERDERGRTPLMLAASFGDIDGVNLLLDRGADVHCTDSTGLNAADWSCIGQFADLTARLAAEGVLPRQIPREQESVTHAARFDAGARSANSAYRTEGLLHISASGSRVRSKSEIVVADALYYLEVPFDYEMPFRGTRTGGFKLPDFTLTGANREVAIWEHLGMLNDSDYRRNWEAKFRWYLQNGLVEGRTLFVTSDDPRGGLDSREIANTARAAKASLSAL